MCTGGRVERVRYFTRMKASAQHHGSQLADTAGDRTGDKDFENVCAVMIDGDIEVAGVEAFDLPGDSGEFFGALDAIGSAFGRFLERRWRFGRHYEFGFRHNRCGWCSDRWLGFDGGEYLPGARAVAIVRDGFATESAGQVIELGDVFDRVGGGAVTSLGNGVVDIALGRSQHQDVLF